MFGRRSGSSFCFSTACRCQPRNACIPCQGVVVMLRFVVRYRSHSQSNKFPFRYANQGCLSALASYILGSRVTTTIIIMIMPDMPTHLPSYRSKPPSTFEHLPSSFHHLRRLQYITSLFTSTFSRFSSLLSIWPVCSIVVHSTRLDHSSSSDLIPWIDLRIFQYSGVYGPIYVPHT